MLNVIATLQRKTSTTIFKMSFHSVDVLSFKLESKNFEFLVFFLDNNSSHLTRHFPA